MSELTPHQQKALISEGHLALTANAGSGKTFVLARKYLDILLKEKVEVSNVAAITFTEKAASELYYKISLLIEEKIKISKKIVEKKKLEKIRRQLVSANISTIHSFCIDILKQFPVEAQLDARFVPIDENLSNELIEISVEEMIRSAFDDKLIIEDIKYLIRIFSSKSKFETEIVRLIKNRKNVFVVKENIYNNDEKHIQEYFSKIFNEYFLLIWERNKNIFLKSISEINSVVLENDRNNQAAIDISHLIGELQTKNDIVSILYGISQIKSIAFTKNVSIRKKGYLKTDLNESLSEEISITEEMMSDLSKFELSAVHKKIELSLAKFSLSVLDFFDQALMIYENKKKAEGFVDFEDILLHTKILLENHDVQRALVGKFKFIMVDEYQDTNEIQYQIFLPILDYLKSGELFIVGDEKQSIYKFRDAEIEIFNLTKDNIKTESGDENLLSLPDSFRMTPAVCTFTNLVFKKLFSNPDVLYGEVLNTELVCARSDNVNGNIELLMPRINNSDEIVEESDLVANKILKIQKDGIYSWKDICILFRKRKNFDELEKSFLKRDIPYAIVGGRGFYQRQTISDLFNYLSFLADENNSTALVGILRSPFFSISDSKLYEISLQKGSGFWRKFKSYVNNKKEFQNILTILEENIKLSSSIELPQLLKKLIADQNYLAVLTSRLDGTQELANLDKLISITRNFNSKGFRNLYDFINHLKDSISGLQDEAQASFSANKDAVQLMTIHQSKGLEFPIVFIYKTAETGLSSSLKSGQIKVDKKFGLLAKLPIDDNYFEEYESAPIISIHNYLESRKNLAELKRLLYVAVTRAKDELYISASTEEGKSFSKDSFISLLSLGLNDKFDGDEIVIKDNLDYLIESNGAYKTKSEKIEFAIPIISELDSLESPVREIPPLSKDYKFDIKKFTAAEKGEIISASKVSIYSQCPLKYFLTYEIGFAKLKADELSYNKMLVDRDISNIQKNYSEEDENIEFSTEQNETINFNSADYGKLIHSILEKEIPIDNLKSDLNAEGKSEEDNSGIIDYPFEKIKIDLSNYFESSTYKRIKSYKDYKNEFEIYAKEDEYFLHGIIDKIIFDGKKLIIFDYKTDDINAKDVEKRAEYYLMQLKFYLYIATKLFKGFDFYEGNLLFIKHPDRPVSIFYDDKEIIMLQKEIKSIIDSLRNRNKEKNYAHCKMCTYSAFTKECIIN